MNPRVPTSRRATVRDPACRHKPTGYVEAGHAATGGAHASTLVCSRPRCIDDARDWAETKTALPARHTLWPLP